VPHKLLLNFTWQVKRKDAEGRTIVQGSLVYKLLKPRPNREECGLKR
jgi:hypothetical protein